VRTPNKNNASHNLDDQSNFPPESVAEFTRRPLLSITAADLGHNPDELERSLLQYFRRANEWDAVVLLDEADIYLEKRSIRDLKRNSIVSGKINSSESAVHAESTQSSYEHSITSKESCSSRPTESANSTKHSCLEFTYR
jgi:hypothetical protein